jgi:Zn-dependent peptidase ImmA (M78 family)
MPYLHFHPRVSAKKNVAVVLPGHRMVQMLSILKVKDKEPKPAIGRSGQIGVNSPKRKISNSPNSDVIINMDGVRLTKQRRRQFLEAAEIIAEGCYDDEGKLDVMRLVEKYGCTVKSIVDPVKYLQRKSREPKYRTVLKGIAYKNEQINGFSFPKEHKIFYNKSAKMKEGQIRFIIIHELVHPLLGHKGLVFYKTSSEPKNLDQLMYYFDHLHKTYDTVNEPIEYSEEADLLTAMLLMRFKFMQKHINDSNAAIAKRFGVIEEAVEKRRKEVKEERSLLR